jgi:hypothetical protein
MHEIYTHLITRSTLLLILQYSYKDSIITALQTKIRIARNCRSRQESQQETKNYKRTHEQNRRRPEECMRGLGTVGVPSPHGWSPECAQVWLPAWSAMESPMESPA